RWLEESKEERVFLSEIERAAELWQQRGRRDEEVWRGDALAEARRKLARLATPVPERISQFLHAGLREEERRRRRKRALTASGFALLAVVAVASLFTAQQMGAQRFSALKGWSRAQQGEAEAQREGASAALGRGHMVETRARLRSSLETQDSLLGRALFWKLQREPLEWTLDLGSIAYDVAYAPDGRSVAVACHDGVVYLVDVETTEIRPFRSDTGAVLSVAYAPVGNFLAGGHLGGRVSIWNLATGSYSTLGGHKKDVPSVAISSDGKRLASAGRDGTVRIFTMPPSGIPERTLEVGTSLNMVAFSPDGSVVAVGGQSKKISLFDAGSGKEVELIGSDAGSTALAFSPDGRLLASGSPDNSISLLSVDSGEEVGALRGHTASLLMLSFSPDGKLLASGSMDKSVRLWDVTRGETIGIQGSRGEIIRGVAFSGDGSRVALAGLDAKLRLWRVASASDGVGTIANRQGMGGDGGHQGEHGHKLAATGLDFSPDGRLLVSSGVDETLRVWDVKTGEEKQQFTGHRGYVETVAMSPDGMLIASGGHDMAIRLWDASSGRLLRLLSGHVSWVRGVVFSAGGKTLVSGCADRTIRLWDAATGVEIRKLVGHKADVAGIAISPDDRLLASASQDGTLRLWDVASGRTVATLASNAQMQAVVFSPDGRIVYASGFDGAVRLWELASKRDRILYQHAETGLDCYLSVDPSGGQLAVPAKDRVLLLSTDSGDQRTLGRCRGNAHRTAFSPDGRLVAATAHDGTVRVWDADRSVPHWRAPLLLRSPLRLFTHRGWIRPEDMPAASAPPGVPGAKWERAVEDRGILGTADAGGDRFLCLQVAGERLEQWDLATDVQVMSEKMPGLEGLVGIEDGCASLAGGEVRVHRRGATTMPLGLTGAVAFASHQGELLVTVGQQMFVVDSSSGTTKASYPVDLGVSAVGRVGDWLVVGYQQGQVELVPARPGAPKPTHTFKGAPSCAVTRLVAGPPGTLAGGYANGTVIVWTIADGAALESAKLHGPIQHLLYSGEKLVVATEVGQHLVWDLSAFLEDYCELMRQVWRSIPVVWENGLPVSRRSIPEHRCAGEVR
ncbi:MAG: WD40 repeat domain-containing protein, partial [Pseudomonadota bacterium]